MKKENEKYLEKHNHKIWFDEKANQWMTYIDEPSVKRGFVLKRRKEKASLEKLIIEHYRAIEEQPWISDIFHDWLTLKFKYGEISEQTRTRYENDFRRFFPDDNEICMKYIADITEIDLEMFIKGNIKKHKLTKKTYNGLKILIKGIFRHARKKKLTDVIISVFFDELDLSKNIFTIREKKTDAEEVYSEEEIPIIKEYLLKKDSLRYLGILLVFVTGLRVGELAALKPEDIRLKENSGTIHVCRTEVHYNEEKEPGKRKNVVRVQEFAKSEAGNRKIIVNSFAVQILRRIQELNADPKEFLFEENGKRIKIQGFSRALRRTCENLEIPFRPMHKIRKTYGTTLLDNQVSETLVAHQMGHADISTTRKYYFRNNQSEKHKIEEIERALSAI
ncbi:tyrosine recombinase XerS [Claveliimonas bilis]|uniref:Tyrosine recombinase XerS n=1 Tax=Claveliimonas bilis TaxID=3028070 RepID=A0ABN6Z6W4_9FIRM|nr:site-specific integrase [Claveliimonas bilis]BDZ78347.1 tyrosine recombinase XerS [Claveliimonas bilis]BDZ83399.1 tyrosine recombinase XerS [Claveliimonas bilis]